MNADFLDAHLRHREDAELLRKEQHWANADHLYGLSAECGLKRLMLAFGMPVNPQGTPHGVDKVHADEIWQRFESYRLRHSRGALYLLPADSPFADWQASQRYAHRSNFTEIHVKPHRNGAETIFNLIRKARWEGLVP